MPRTSAKPRPSDEVVVIEDSVPVQNVGTAFPPDVNGDVAAVVQSAPYQEMVGWYFDEYPANSESPGMVAASIIQNLLGTSADDILDVPESLDSAGKWTHKPIRLVGVDSVSPSAYGGIYVRVDVVDMMTGDKDRITVGSPTMLAQLMVLVKAGKLPLDCKIVPVKRAVEGRNPPLYFRSLKY